MSEDEFTPATRSGHVAVSYGKVVMVWGGYHAIYEFIEGGNGFQTAHDAYIPTNRIWLYHTDIQKWYCQKTNGKAPPGTSGASAVAVGDRVYMFGGHTDNGNSNELYALDMSSWTWDHIIINDQSKKPSPRDKAVMWEYKNKLYVFGGFGPTIHPFLCDHGEFVVDAANFKQKMGDKLS